MAGPYCRESTVRKAQKRTYDKLGYTISRASACSFHFDEHLTNDLCFTHTSIYN